MKTFICRLLLLFTGTGFTQITIAQYSGQKFTITVNNATFFDLYAEGHPDEGQGIFHPYTARIKKGTSFTYECKNSNAFKGVEGHIKFRAYNNEVPGWIDIYFDNPAVGSMKYNATTDWPFIIENFVEPKEKRFPNAWIIVTADTTHNKKPPVPLQGSGGVTPKPGTVPDIIQFDWQVTQRMRKDEDDENDGKAYKYVTYFFTSSGDYAAVKPEGKSFSLMIYSKDGHTWMIDDTKKTITIMNMAKTVGEGALLGKALAEDINKAPLHKDKDETITITKTGKTKQLLGYTAEEYELKNKQVLTTKNAAKSGTASFWYATVPFDPVKIYTMGAGRPADLSKLQNNPKMKNNIAAIPVMNKNYLWMETESGNIKGMETIEIKKVNNTIRTAGYKIKVMNNLKDMMKGDN